MQNKGASQLQGIGGRLVDVRVLLLDDNVLMLQIPSRALGKHLYSMLVDHLQLLDAEYFDLEYVNHEGVRCWLDHEKPLLKQVGKMHGWSFRFSVRFYTPHPNLLEDEFTRYLFARQIKRDLRSGQLICGNNTAALLASYIAQGELGDNNVHDTSTYLRCIKLLPEAREPLLDKVAVLHKEHRGMTTADADFNLLDTARKIEFYGMRMNVVKDQCGLSLNITVTHQGISILQNFVKINTFSWAKIRKLSFRRKRFLIKLLPDDSAYFTEELDFFFNSRDECKRFWKKCVEHHAFFRRESSDGANNEQRHRSHIVTRGSSYRYSGRTEKELVQFVRDNSLLKRNRNRPVSVTMSLPLSREMHHKSAEPPAGRSQDASLRNILCSPAVSMEKLCIETEPPVFQRGDHQLSLSETEKFCPIRESSLGPEEMEAVKKACRNEILAQLKAQSPYRQLDDDNSLGNSCLNGIKNEEEIEDENKSLIKETTNIIKCSPSPEGLLNRVICMDQFSFSDFSDSQSLFNPITSSELTTTPPTSASATTAAAATTTTTTTTTTANQQPPIIPSDKVDNLYYTLHRRHVNRRMIISQCEQVAHSRSYDRRLATSGMRDRRKSEWDTISAINDDLRQRGRNVSMSQFNGHGHFVRAVRLPSVNSFSAHDDTASPKFHKSVVPCRSASVRSRLGYSVDKETEEIVIVTKSCSNSRQQGHSSIGSSLLLDYSSSSTSSSSSSIAIHNSQRPLSVSDVASVPTASSGLYNIKNRRTTSNCHSPSSSVSLDLSSHASSMSSFHISPNHAKNVSLPRHHYKNQVKQSSKSSHKPPQPPSQPSPQQAPITTTTTTSKQSKDNMSLLRMYSSLELSSSSSAIAMDADIDDSSSDCDDIDRCTEAWCYNHIDALDYESKLETNLSHSFKYNQGFDDDDEEEEGNQSPITMLFLPAAVFHGKAIQEHLERTLFSKDVPNKCCSAPPPINIRSDEEFLGWARTHQFVDHNSVTIPISLSKNVEFFPLPPQTMLRKSPIQENTKRHQNATSSKMSHNNKTFSSVYNACYDTVSDEEEDDEDDDDDDDDDVSACHLAVVATESI